MTTLTTTINGRSVKSFCMEPGEWFFTVRNGAQSDIRQASKKMAVVGEASIDIEVFAFATQAEAEAAR